MANIGEQLLQPESGWRRIEDTNISIKYDGEWTFYENASFSGNSAHYNNTKDFVSFIFYGSKLRIISEYFDNRDTDNLIIIDDVEYNFNCYSTTKKSKVIAFEKLDLQKGCHTVKIANMNVGKYFLLDCIDIDEDGYMVYCDTNGKLYYDMTPIMTSNTTPDGYEASASNYLNDSHLPYKAFNGSNNSATDCWGISDTNGYIQLDFFNKTKISDFVLLNRNHSDYVVQSPKYISLYGSNDGNTFTKIKEFDNIEWNKPNQTILFKIDTNNYRYYKLEISESTGDSIFIGELRYLLAVDTPFYLIRDNSTNKVYNYDEDNNQLIEVSDTSILNEDALNNTCIYDLTKVKDLIDLTDDNITILSNQNTKLIVDGIKNDKELIVSNQNLSIVNSETIHNFLFEVTKVANGDCKFVISADNGLTWLSWNGSSWDTLTNTATLDSENKIKQYSKLSDSEKVQWNKLRDEIWTNGMSTDITDVDYNSILTNKTIRFAFVLYRPTYDDNIILKDTKWLFDKVGSWHKLSEDDIDIAINSNMCTVTPKLQNLEHVKVNILL